MVINILTTINRILWGIVTLLLLISGVYFTQKLKFIQFKFKDMFKGFKKNDNNEVSPFETLMLTLGARIGVGSLAGVALSIYMGGPGTIFWMWIATFIVAPNAYVESYFGVLYHRKQEQINRGGPSYYINDGLKQKWLAKVYALLVIITYIFGFLTIQSNTIAKSFQILEVHPLLIGIILSIVTGYIIMKGAKKIISVSSKIMPLIGIIYLGTCIFIICQNYSILPKIIKEIIQSAFNVRAVSGGIVSSFIIGFQRGIFSNEAGVGSGAIAAATVDNDDARGQGMIQMIGIYFTTLILCTMTAIVIMMSRYASISFDNINGIEITQYALTYHLGSFGDFVLLITIFIFAFSTIISGYYYGENSLRFLKKEVSKRNIFLLQILTMILLILGSVANPLLLWNLVDILIAIMAIINVYALFKLRKKVK